MIMKKIMNLFKIKKMKKNKTLNLLKISNLVIKLNLKFLKQVKKYRIAKIKLMKIRIQWQP